MRIQVKPGIKEGASKEWSKVKKMEKAILGSRAA